MYYISSSSLFLLLFSFQFVYPRIIKTSLGRLEGKQSGKYQLFRRIPFAKPPIGTLRFQKPESAEKWNGVWNATGEFTVNSYILTVIIRIWTRVYVQFNMDPEPSKMGR